MVSASERWAASTTVHRPCREYQRQEAQGAGGAADPGVPLEQAVPLGVVADATALGPFLARAGRA